MVEFASIISFRIVNLLHVKPSAKDSMWKIVQENRKLLMSNYVECSYLKVLTPDAQMSAYYKYINTIASAQKKENLIQWGMARSRFT